MSDPQQMLSALGQLDDDALTSVITQLLQSRPECAPAIMVMACPDLTYAPTRALTDRRCSGVIKGASDASEFGSINCPELHAVFGCDVLVNRKQVGSLKDGTQVSFAVTLTKDNQPQAFDLMLVAPAPNSGAPDMAAQMAAMAAMSGGMPGSMPGAIPGAMPGGMPGGGMPGGGAMNGMDMTQMNPMMAAMGMGGMTGMNVDPAAMAMMSMGQMMPPGELFGASKGGKKGGGQRGDQEVLGEFFGVIKSYNPEKGFGFIACDALKEKHSGDVYLHQRHVADFQVGAEVKFQAYLHQGRLQGRDLQDATGQVGMQQGGFSKPAVQAGGGEELGTFVGTIKSYNVEKGFGFIESADLKGQGYEMDAFLHKDFLGAFNVGDMVSFAAFLKDSKLRARDLQVAGGGMGGMVNVPPPPISGMGCMDGGMQIGKGCMGCIDGGMGGPPGMNMIMDVGGGCDAMMKGKGMNIGKGMDMSGFGDGCGKGFKMDMKGMMMGKGSMGDMMMGMDGFGGEDNPMKRMKMI